MTRQIPVALVLAITVAVLASGLFLYRVQQEERARTAEAEVHFNKAMALFTRELWGETIQELERIPREPAPDWRVPYYQGSAAIKLNNYDDAIVYLDRAFALNPREARIPFALGVAYYRVGKLGLAKGYFAAALELDPSNEDAKGLMDVMANLERYQVQPAQVESIPDTGDGDD